LLATLALASAPAFAAPEALMLVQNSPLAGFRYYQGTALWDDMKVGDRLQLVREADNPHDVNAIRIEWNGQPLGYLPRRENAAVARHMDRGARVEARITQLKQSRNPWQRIAFDVLVKLD
jgi:hypothetical protein